MTKFLNYGDFVEFLIAAQCSDCWREGGISFGKNTMDSALLDWAFETSLDYSTENAPSADIQSVINILKECKPDSCHAPANLIYFWQIAEQVKEWHVEIDAAIADYYKKNYKPFPYNPNKGDNVICALVWCAVEHRAKMLAKILEGLKDEN
jgi:hypothetical protein